MAVTAGRDPEFLLGEVVSGADGADAFGGGPTAASRAALASSSVSVRSAARNRSASVSDLRPSPICGPV